MNATFLQPKIKTYQPAWQESPITLASLAASFGPISLEQMSNVALLNRTDTKFLLTREQLLRALAKLQPEYWMLTVEGVRLHNYRTLYFDTPDFELYHDHVHGRAERYKVRSREYADSHLSFLEVKHKTRKARTIKERIATIHPVSQINLETRRWLADVSPLDGANLEPKLWNTFRRITLVGRQGCERVTLDVDLSFFTLEHFVHLNGLVIAEVKLDAAQANSPFLAHMREQRIQPNGFSKYAIGVAMLYENVKKNALKPRMRLIEKVMKGYPHD